MHAPLGLIMADLDPQNTASGKGGVEMGSEKEGEWKGKIYGMGCCLSKALAISVIQIRSEHVRGKIEL